MANILLLMLGVKVFAYTSENEIINPNKEHSLEMILKNDKSPKGLSRRKKGSKID